MPSRFWPAANAIAQAAAWLTIATVVRPAIAASSAADESPYQARVAGEDVYIRSGPGIDYYPTAKLQTGDVVEVYRKDPGGWCAIRPPRSSFSLIALRQLKPLGDGIALAREGKIEVHVGSALGDMRDVIQVRLDRDEPVEVLEEPDHDRPDAWVKVAPPPGEFRWISSRYLERQPRARGMGRGGASTAGRASPDPLPEPTQWTQPGIRGGGSFDAAALGGASASRGAGGSREIDAINGQLSARVVQDISQWQFEDLRQRGERVLDGSPSANDRAAAQTLLDKIARFENIRFRREAFQQRGGQVARAGGAAGPPPAHIAVAPARYDGSGRLTPVASIKVGSPQFALVDATGAVVEYVSPAPGVNLQPFVNKQIGIVGPRSYVPDANGPNFQRPLISAQRVTPLDDGTRRY